MIFRTCSHQVFPSRYMSTGSAGTRVVIDGPSGEGEEKAPRSSLPVPESGQTSTRHRFTNMRVQNWCGLRAYQKFFSLKHTLSRIRGTSLTYAAVPIVPVVQSLRSVQAVQSRECVKDSYQGLFEVCARSTTLFALGVRNQKALWPFRSRLYGHVQPHPPTGQRHRPRRDRAKHAANSRPYGAGI
jgi:hypothetical protein